MKSYSQFTLDLKVPFSISALFFVQTLPKEQMKAKTKTKNFILLPLITHDETRLNYGNILKQHLMLSGAVKGCLSVLV